MAMSRPRTPMRSRSSSVSRFTRVPPAPFALAPRPEGRKPRFAAHARSRRQQSHQRKRQHRFPAPRFADKPKRFARFERKRNVVHRTNPSRRRRNLDGESTQLDQWRHCYIIRRIVLSSWRERSVELASGNPIAPPSERGPSRRFLFLQPERTRQKRSE